MMRPGALRVGTRTSPLARSQTAEAIAVLQRVAPHLEFEVVPIGTRADQQAAADGHHPFGERGIFVSELVAALSSDRIDLAVHSAKDVPLVDDDPEIPLAAWLPRIDPRDALCLSVVPGAHQPASLAELPEAARIGTSSTRRAAALRALRPDLQIEPLRGNVQTRLARAAERGLAGCVLARAGLLRLGLAERASITLDVDELVPEAGQGAIVIQAHHERCAPIDWQQVTHADTQWAVRIERAVARALDGGCTRAVGVHVDGDSHGWVFLGDDAGAGVTSSVALERSFSHDAAVEALVASAREVVQ